MWCQYGLGFVAFTPQGDGTRFLGAAVSKEIAPELE